MAEYTDNVEAWLNKLSPTTYAKEFRSAGYSNLLQCASSTKADLSSVGMTKPGRVCRLIRNFERMKPDGELERRPSPQNFLSLLHKSPTNLTTWHSSPSLFSKAKEQPLLPLTDNPHMSLTSDKTTELSPLPVKSLLKKDEEEKLPISNGRLLGLPPPLPPKPIVPTPPPPPPLEDLSDEESSLMLKTANTTLAASHTSLLGEAEVPPPPGQVSSEDDKKSPPPPIPPRPISTSTTQLKLVKSSLKENDNFPPPPPRRKILVPPPPPPMSSSDTE